MEALRGRRRLRRLFVLDGIGDDLRLREALATAEERRIPIQGMQRHELDAMLEGANHQGVALLAGGYPYATLAEITERSGTVLVLDHLQDPQNVGTLLRAAEAAGVAGVVMPRDRSVAITPAAVNASSGAVEHLLIAQEANIARTVDHLKQTGRWAIGLDTGPNAVPLFESDLPLPATLVVGAEGAGMTPIVRKACDLIVQIPMMGRVGSLNAATAGSIALFEFVRRQRLAGD